MNRFFAAVSFGVASLPSLSPLGVGATAFLVAIGTCFLIDAIREPRA